MTPILIALLFALLGLLLWLLPLPAPFARIGEIVFFWGIGLVIIIATGRGFGL